MTMEVSRVHIYRGILWCILAADQRDGEPVWVAHVVKAESALNAEPISIRGAVSAAHCGDRIILHQVVDLTTYAAIGAYTRHLGVSLPLIRPGCVH